MLGRERIEAGQLALHYEAGAFTLKGEARVAGSPATIDLQSGRRGGGSAVVQLTLDEAARARRSLPVAPALAGPVPVRIVAPLGGKGPSGQPRVEADLTRASIDNLLPGWTKAAGKPGRLSFTLGEGDSPELRDLVLDAGSVQAKGSVSLSDGGGVERADLPTFKLSPGDDLKVQVERAGGAYKVTLKGGNGDARPLIKFLTSPSSGGKGGARDVPDLELDLGISILTGFAEEALTGVSGRVSIRNRDLRALQLGGRMKAGSVEAKLSKRDTGDPVLSVQSSDAGSTLRFLDLYRRMVGGKLSLEARMGETAQTGSVAIDAFTLRSEPALGRLVSEAGPRTGEDRNGGPALAINPNDVQFVKLTGDFRRSAGRIEFQDAVIWGAQVGFTLAGSVDFARDRTDVSGTFVPAYTLNNAFSQVPIVGLLLGGGNRNEGLFAIDFKVTGPVNAPIVTVNPLSAVAPGILRKLFGWVLPDGEAPAETGAARTRPER